MFRTAERSRLPEGILDTGGRALEAAASRIVDAGRRLDALGLTRSVAGNISERLPATAFGPGAFAITRSGPRKGFLVPGDVIVVDSDGGPARPEDVPSAETVLHARLYRRSSSVGAVLHGHSVPATVLTRTRAGDLVFEGYEMLKAFGTGTHAARMVLPVFENDQDMDRLASRIDARLDGLPVETTMGYVLAGHGLYAWGRDMEDALSRLEAAEFLLACALEEARITR